MSRTSSFFSGLIHKLISVIKTSLASWLWKRQFYSITVKCSYPKTDYKRVRYKKHFAYNWQTVTKQLWSRGFVDPYFSHFVFVTRGENLYIFVTLCDKYVKKSSQKSNIFVTRVTFAFDIDFTGSTNTYLSHLLCLKHPKKLHLFQIRKLSYVLWKCGFRDRQMKTSVMCRNRIFRIICFSNTNALVKSDKSALKTDFFFWCACFEDYPNLILNS